MSHKSTIPFWSVDAFLYWVMPKRTETKWSSELLSRTSTFVDAYVLFEKVVLPERYKKESVLKKLDPNGDIFEFIESNSLVNSDEITKGITIDLSVDIENFLDLQQEDYKWFSQHNGHMERKDFDSVMETTSLSFAHLRLWQLSLVNEISENTGSTTILPISLQNIDNASSSKIPFQMQKISELNSYFQQSIKSVSEVIGESFHGFIENSPPLFSLLIDQSQSREHAIEVLSQLRRDFKELRFKANEFENLVKKSNSLREQNEIVKEWSNSWGLLLKGDFQKPQFLRRKLSLDVVSKSVVKPQTAGLSSFIQAYLEFREERKAYNRFRIYSDLYNELDGIKDSKEKLRNKFSIELVNIIEH